MINRSESELIALERRNQALRARRNGEPARHKVQKNAKPTNKGRKRSKDPDS